MPRSEHENTYGTSGIKRRPSRIVINTYHSFFLEMSQVAKSNSEYSAKYREIITKLPNYQNITRTSRELRCTWNVKRTRVWPRKGVVKFDSKEDGVSLSDMTKLLMVKGISPFGWQKDYLNWLYINEFASDEDAIKRGIRRTSLSSRAQSIESDWMKIQIQQNYSSQRDVSQIQIEVPTMRLIDGEERLSRLLMEAAVLNMKPLRYSWRGSKKNTSEPSRETINQNQSNLDTEADESVNTDDSPMDPTSRTPVNPYNTLHIQIPWSEQDTAWSQSENAASSSFFDSQSFDIPFITTDPQMPLEQHSACVHNGSHMVLDARPDVNPGISLTAPAWNSCYPLAPVHLTSIDSSGYDTSLLYHNPQPFQSLAELGTSTFGGITAQTQDVYPCSTYPLDPLITQRGFKRPYPTLGNQDCEVQTGLDQSGSLPLQSLDRYQ